MTAPDPGAQRPPLPHQVRRHYRENMSTAGATGRAQQPRDAQVGAPVDELLRGRGAGLRVRVTVGGIDVCGLHLRPQPAHDRDDVDTINRQPQRIVTITGSRDAFVTRVNTDERSAISKDDVV